MNILVRQPLASAADAGTIWAQWTLVIGTHLLTLLNTTYQCHLYVKVDCNLHSVYSRWTTRYLLK